jgi:hypothetical protein
MLGYELHNRLAISSSPLKLGGITDQLVANLLEYEEFILVRNDVTSLGNYLLTFRRIILHLSSRALMTLKHRN